MKSNKFGYLIQEGFKSIFTHGFMSFATVTIVVACLVIMGSFTLIAVNVDSMLDDLESENEMIAYVEETLTEEEARALQSEIEYISNVSSCEFVTREQAMEEFAAQYEDDSLFEDVDSSVFRHRFIIYLNDISLMEETKDSVEDITGIAKVSAYLEVAEGFVTVRNVMSAVSLVLIVVLVVVCVFIMSNTVKLATYSRRDEIAIMKMVGASNWFIRFPFVVEGLVLGLLGGFLAYFLEWGLYDVVANRTMSGMMGSLLAVVSFSAMSVYVLVIYLAVGLVVGVFGSSVAIRNYLQV
ncbi:MAG: permease-like cell division protein FtsX [Oscillospiraceae bacterium]|nr:permease-like cell division protein FtsX [Oscillospiraceae bacterium]